MAQTLITDKNLSPTGTMPAWDGSALTGVSGGGKVLQVVSTTKSDVFSDTNGTNWSDVTGLTTSITPSATSSKILVCWNVALGVSNANNNVFMRILRGTTPISVGDAFLNRNRSTGGGFVHNASAWVMVAGTYLDSPATNSVINYKAQLSSQGSVTKYVNSDGTRANVNYSVGTTASTITVMEIGE